MRKKLAVLFVVVLLAFVALSVRLIMINKENGDNYKKQILSQQNYVSTVLPFKRGDILDSQGSKLAYSEKVYNLVVDSNLINATEGALEPTVAALHECFGLDEIEMRNYITSHKDSRYYKPLKRLSYEKIEPFVKKQNDPLENPGIAGIWFEEEYKRVYPYGPLAADVIGFTTDDNIGTFGLEGYYNETLNGLNGREYGYLTDNEDLERSTIGAKDGQTIVTTIDANIQAVVEKYMTKWNREHEGQYAFRTGELGSKNTGVIVMNPNNGEILAMASYPRFDLSDPRSLSENGLYTSEEIAAMDEETYYKNLNNIWRNFCISDTYEPGSTAKSLTVAAALDSGAINGNEVYYCDGSLEVGGHNIHCHNRLGHGQVSVPYSLEQSCNVALMHIGQAMGKETMAKYLQNYNMGLKTNIDLSGEARTDTLVYNAADMVSSDLAISTFGQGYNCTMIQMACAFSSVINGGYYYQPHMVKEVRNSDGTVAKKVEPRVLKQTISETTSDRMREYLNGVTLNGTGKTAVPAGYRIGGKTGTAEMYPRGTGNYVVSFIGYAPADDPQVVVYVVIDRPNTDSQPHSSYAQEITRNIFNEILPYLQIFRTEELTDEERAELMELGIIPQPMIENASDGSELETVETSVGEGEGVNPAVNVTTDPATGNVIDPKTGIALDPSTYEPVDPTVSDLDNIGALIDEESNISIE